jgi:predicted ABC-type ATPase
MKKAPILQIIAGPNGAGKSTFARAFLKGESAGEFLNADYLAMGLSPFNPSAQAIRAGRLLLSRWDELSRLQKSFTVESTLSGLTYLSRIQALKNQGYEIRMIYLWLPSAEMAIRRVRQRVKKGGHFVPENDIRRRFGVSFKNFRARYSLIADEWLIYDSSSNTPKLIVACRDKIPHILLRQIYDRIIKTEEP